MSATNKGLGDWKSGKLGKMRWVKKWEGERMVGRKLRRDGLALKPLQNGNEATGNRWREERWKGGRRGREGGTETYKGRKGGREEGTKTYRGRKGGREGGTETYKQRKRDCCMACFTNLEKPTKPLANAKTSYLYPEFFTTYK